MARLIGAPPSARVRTVLRGFGAGKVAAGLAVVALAREASPEADEIASRGFEVRYSIAGVYGGSSTNSRWGPSSIDR